MADVTGTNGADVLTGTAGDDRINGLAGDDHLSGLAGNDVLDGGTGADIMEGGPGFDEYHVDDPNDQVLELSLEGGDFVYASVSYSLQPGSEIEVLRAEDFASTTSLILSGNEFSNLIQGNAGNNGLFGNGGSDSLVGLAGNDQLDGGAGIDQTDGGPGDDTHFVDNVADTIIERAGEGVRDAAFASSSYALADGVYVEILSTAAWVGTASINLTGNSLAQEIYGNAGNNILDGGTGSDLLVGFGGNDTYFVHDANATIVEAASEGNRDAVFTSVSYTLNSAAYAEVLSTDNWAGTQSINLTGSVASQEIYGNAGANVLNGGGGGDSLFGFGGNDVYFVDSSDDFVFENGGEGTRDVVFASTSYALAGGAEIEIISTSDWQSTASINLTGNGVSQEVYGNAGVNLLNGGDGNDQIFGFAGNDTLIGGWGADVLSGGLGADVFKFLNLESGDVITDFQSGTDKIDVGALITSQNFHFIGSDPFTGVAGQTRFADGHLQLDGNADGIADLDITILGSAVTASDFLFG